MRFIKIYSTLLILLLLTNSCKKNPVVSFTTDKTEYSAGQKVKLTNTTEKGKDYIWTMPDGTIVNSENAEYTIGSNTGFTNLKFELSAKAKYGCRHHSLNQIVKVIPQSWFAWTSIIYIPESLTSTINNSNYTVIASYIKRSSTGSGFILSQTDLIMNFPNAAPPLAGTYVLQSSNSNLTSNTAFMKFYEHPTDGVPSTSIVSGQIHVEYTHDKLHIYFTNADTAPFSGDLYLNP